MLMDSPAPSVPAFRFLQVSKRYGAIAALTDFSLEIPVGQTFGLVGMNGAGKTTLIKSLLDFSDIDGGSIEIFGVSHRITRARSRLAYLPERFNPPFYLTGEDFVRYMLELQDVSYDARTVADAFAALDLDLSALKKPVRTFSKGMTQKLGLAACLLTGKDVYVLDEPTSGLDPKARALLKRRLREVRADGRTVFLTSHALADVEELCDGMAVIHQGTLRFTGTPSELRMLYQGESLEQAFLSCIRDAAIGVG
jgi:ABC-2 type transport system ATP-binding protein